MTAKVKNNDLSISLYGEHKVVTLACVDIVKGFYLALKKSDPTSGEVFLLLIKIMTKDPTLDIHTNNEAIVGEDL